ncbi:uncharacterized protein M6B38_162680 [Iris pallida]|uniref:Uncharacterized protein n=1 Tax=Iris pallida TaxID=29817 RepID=A0AAX6F080_IRIPA|nr:uncharacterized protein M6B38_162680 [Iris pallida]
MDGGDVSEEVGSSHRSGECEALGKAISTTLGSVIKELDSRAENVAQSQDELFLVLDRLTGGNLGFSL